MKTQIFADKSQMSAAASSYAASLIREKLREQAQVRLIAATGGSQIAFLEFLAGEPSVDWTRVELFHLDEYIGLGQHHPASFALYIKERIIQPLGITKFHLLDGERPPSESIEQMNAAIREHPVDVAFVGIGENAHLAFNDPPADFETEEPYLVVELDRACRQQQVNEGWFPSLDEVPKQALSMSVRQILKSRQIVCVVPGKQKAQAVRTSIEGPITPAVPASILRTHPDVALFLDRDSAADLSS